MQLGLRLPQTGINHAKKENIIQVAEKSDIAGFNSLWVLERLIWPVNPQDQYAGSKDGNFPHDWQYIFDPIETLTFVASKTKRIKLGTSVVDMLFHNPLTLSKRFTTLDILSDGRAIAGLGIGWARDEYQASGIPFRNRGDRADEYLQVLKKIWANDIVEFAGHYYSVPPSKIGPKPLQKPRIPIYLGGYSEKTFARIANHADGWICSIRDSLRQTKSNIEMIKKECLKVNRDPDEIEIAAIVYPNIEGLNSDDDYIEPAQPNGKWQKQQMKNSRHLLNGSVEQLAGDLRQIGEIGVDLAVLNYNRSPISNSIDGMIEVTRQLDKLVK
jgi:probable F420-dependent oxidoreductase